jgi:hypothetical protein
MTEEPDHGCAGPDLCRLCAYREGRPDPTGGDGGAGARARADEARADAAWVAERRGRTRPTGADGP